MSYGQLPVNLGTYQVDCKEMMFYQYLPIKFPGDHTPIYEERLAPFNGLIGTVCRDYIGSFGLDAFMSQYVYITAKRLFQAPGCSFNRPGSGSGYNGDDGVFRNWLPWRIQGRGKAHTGRNRFNR